MYSQFLKEVAKVAGVEPRELDSKNMRWKHRKPATFSPINISDEESYEIMIQAIRNKKELDRWIIVEMGKPLISGAVGLVFFLETFKLIKFPAMGPINRTELQSR
jgi:hypothetical protein